ncbi:cytochrome c oxidase subunit 6A1, mitochondrial-like [Belonocnema kinseyi]|uniref:cytochrome c oxidase subunit 6A1, mitochondrial-like n=1 Tax=Belonocnema kinseyi TaxID=2817044 RepID=UPI00143CEB79|nr:cytochrome c oxidase subunit 6A1, mitochondrial-like [Belonocnema kinseyi]
MASLIVRQSVRRYSASPLPTKQDYQHAEKAAKMWEKLSLFVAIPVCIITAANTYFNHHEHERPEFIPYDHLRIRNKKFPWGDGNHTLFHNPKVNALPTGYED